MPDLTRLPDLPRDLAEFAEIMPAADAASEAKMPILHPEVRAAVVEWLREISSPEELRAMGLEARRRCLLSGPPGCGKTTLAHHFAARLGLPLACVRAESLISKYLGDTGRAVGRLLDAAKAAKGKCVIFFDEIDAIGRARGTGGSSGASQEMDRAMTVILREFERMETLCLAATNTLDLIDPALRRRFDLQMEVLLPGAEQRAAILTRYFNPLEWDETALKVLVEATAGASPAWLEILMKNLKRARVIWPKLKRPLVAADVFATVLATMDPSMWRQPSEGRFSEIARCWDGISPDPRQP